MKEIVKDIAACPKLVILPDSGLLAKSVIKLAISPFRGDCPPLTQRDAEALASALSRSGKTVFCQGRGLEFQWYSKGDKYMIGCQPQHTHESSCVRWVVSALPLEDEGYIKRTQKGLFYGLRQYPAKPTRTLTY
jgi:hypothetical protein